MVWTKHLCRMCAQIGDASYPIFDTTSGRNIEMKMKKCFSFVVFRDDHKPKEICNCCYMKLNQLYEFVEMCYSSNSKFENIIYSTNQSLRLEKQTGNCDDSQLNGVIVNTKGNLGNQLSDSDVVMVVDYENSLDLNPTCNDPLCLNTTHCGDFRMHGIQVKKQKSNVNFKTYQCYEQSQTVLRHSSDFYKSLESNNVDSFINFSENVVNYDNMDNRYNKFIEKESTLCDIINIKDNDVLHTNNIDLNPTEQRKECVKLKTNKKTFSCHHCGKKFMRKASLNVHLSIHTKIRPFNCDLCSKTFAIERDLRCHKRIHNNIHQCEYCNKSFSVPSKLERHLRIHTNTKPFICPVEHCRKSFSDKCNLEGHKLSHSSKKEFACDVCNKSYKTNSQLKDHKKVHSDITPYKCNLCGKMYKWKTNLTVHMKKHEGYKCIRCNKDCEKLSKLFKHRKLCKSGLAIEEEMAIQPELVLDGGNFYIDPNIALFEDPLPEPEPELKEPPSGIIPERAFTFLLQDMIVNNAEDGQWPLVPSLWQQLELKNMNRLSYEFFGHVELVEWKDFVIYNLCIDFPDEPELMQTRNQFREFDVDSNEYVYDYQFKTVKFWFEKQFNTEDSHELLRLREMKDLLFKLYRISEETVNYTALLLAFCKDVEAHLGLAKALQLSLGRFVCWDSEIGENFVKILRQRRLEQLQEKLHAEQEQAEKFDTANEIVDDIIDVTVHQCDSCYLESYDTNLTNSKDLIMDQELIYLENLMDEYEMQYEYYQCEENSSQHFLQEQFSNAEIGYEPESYPMKAYYLPFDLLITVMTAAMPWQAVSKNPNELGFRQKLEDIYKNCQNQEFEDVFMHEFLNSQVLKEFLENNFKFVIKKPTEIINKLLEDK